MIGSDQETGLAPRTGSVLVTGPILVIGLAPSIGLVMVTEP